MHIINVTKANQERISEILRGSGIPFEVYSVPADYSVLSSEAAIPVSLVEELTPLVVESGTAWDWRKVEGSEGLAFATLKIESNQGEENV